MKTVFVKSLIVLLAAVPIGLSATAQAQVTVGTPYTINMSVPRNENESFSDCDSGIPSGQQSCTTTSGSINYTAEISLYRNNAQIDVTSNYIGSTSYGGVDGANNRNWRGGFDFSGVQERYFIRYRKSTTTCRRTAGVSVTVCSSDTSSYRTLVNTVTFKGLSNISLNAANATPGDQFNNGTPDVVAIAVKNNGPKDSYAPFNFNYTVPNGWAVNSPPSGDGFTCTPSSCTLTSILPAGETRTINLPISLVNILQYQAQAANLRVVETSGQNTSINAGSNEIYANGSIESCPYSGNCTSGFENLRTSTVISAHELNFTPGQFSINGIVGFPNLKAEANATSTPRGANGSRVYTLTNVGTGTTNGSINLTIKTIGVTNTTLNATGWTCNQNPGNYTCSIPGPFAPNSVLPNATLNFRVPQGTAPIDTTATISGLADSDLSNNTTGPDGPSAVNDLVLALNNGGQQFTAGVPGVYNLIVTNNGPSNTESNTIVDLTLPAGVTITASTGFTFTNPARTQLTDSSVLPAGSSKTYTLTAIASSAVAEPFVVEAKVSNATDPIATNNTAGVATNLRKPNLALSASVPTVTVLGGSSSSTFTIRNVDRGTFFGTNTLNGSSSNANLQITGASSSSSAYSCSTTTTSFTCVNTTGLAGLEIATITVTTSGQAIGTGTLNAVLNADNDINTSNNSASGATTVTRQNDFSLEFAANTTTCTAGVACSYTVTVTNNGPSPSSAPISLNISLPAGVTASNGANFSGNTPVTSGSIATYTDTGSSIPRGGTKVYTITLIASSATPDTMVISATLSNSDDNDTSNNSALASTPIIKPDLSLSASVAAITALGSEKTATFTISNLGAYAFAGSSSLTGGRNNASVSLKGVTSSDPAYVCNSASTSFTCTNTTGLALAGNAVITVTYQGDSLGGSGLNAALAAANDVDTGNNAAGGTTTITRQSDLALSITPVGQCSVNSACAFDVTVTNAGPSPSAGAFALSLPVPANVTAELSSGFASAPAVASGTATYTDADLQLTSGSSRVYQIRLLPRINSDNPLAITVTGATASDGNAENNSSSASVTVSKPDLKLTVSQVPPVTPLGAGLLTTYTITNSGDAPSNSSVTFTGGIDANLTLTSIDSGPGWNCAIAGNNRDFICTLTSPIAPQTSRSVQLTMSAVSTGTANLTSVLSGELSQNVGSSLLGVQTQVTRLNDFSVAVSSAPNFTAGVPGAYTVTLTNNGPSASGAGIPVTFTLELPNNVSYSAQSGFSGEPTVAGNTVTLSDTPMLGSSASKAYSITVTPTSRATDPFTAQLSVSSSTDINAANNNASVTTRVVKPDLALTASVTSVTALGGSSTSSFTVRNLAIDAFAGSNSLSGSVRNATFAITDATSNNAAYTCTNTTDAFTCTNLSGLPVAGEAVVTVTLSGVNVGVGGLDAVLTATNDIDLGNNTTGNTASVTRQSDLETTVAGPASCLVNQTCAYTVSVTNNGPSPSAGLYNLTLQIPGGASANPGTSFSTNTPTISGNTATYTDADLRLASGASTSFTVRFTPTNATPESIDVIVAGANASDPNAGNNSSRVSPRVNVVKFDAALTAEPTISVPVQGVFTSSLSVTNTLGNSFSPALTVSGTTNDSKLEFQNVGGPGWTCSNTVSSFTCASNATFTALQNRAITITTKAVGLGTGGWTAMLESIDDNNTGNNSAGRAVTVTAPALEMIKTVQRVAQNADGTANVVFRIDATNSSPEGLTTVISDDLRSLGAGAVLVGTPSIGFPVAGAAPVSTLAISSTYNGSSDTNLAAGVLAAGATARIEFTVKVVPVAGANNQSTAVSSGVISGTGVPSSSNPAGGAGNGGATTISLPLVGLAKAGTVTNNNDGTFDIAYVITVKNYGSEALRDTVVTDDLSGLPSASIVSTPVVTITNAGAGGSTLSVNPGFNGSSDKALTGGRLALNATATIGFTVRVAPTTAAQANFTNTANVTATGETSGLPTGDSSTPGTNPNPGGNGNPVGDGGATVTPFVETTNITITKNAGPVTVTASGKLQSTITLTVTNSGNTRGTINVSDAVSSTYGASLLGVSPVTVTNSVTGSSNLSANPSFSGSGIAANVDLAASGTINGFSSATVVYTITLDPATLTTNPISPATIDGSTTLGTVITGSSAPVSLGTGIVTGTTCYDANRNGVCDPGETPLPGGVTVTITCNGGNAIQTATAPNGSYSSSVPSGTCVVTYNPGPGGITPPAVTIEVPVSTTLNPTPVTVPPTPIRAVSTVNGVVFNDLDGNGLRGAGEPGIAGVTVTIDAGKASAQTLTTSSSGAYGATTTAGSHTIAITAPSGYKLTGSSTAVQTVTTTVEQDLTAAPSGVQGRATINGSIFNDLNGNAVNDAGEPAILGASVTLTSEYGETKSVTPSSSGAYSAELPAGKVTVTASAPVGFAATTPNPVTVTTNAGESSSAAPIGFAQFTSVSGVVWQDSNLDGKRQASELGQPNVAVTITTPGFAAVRTMTNSSGAYSLSTPVGSAKLEIAVPTAMSVTTGNNPQTVTVNATGSNAAAPIGVMFDSGTVTGSVFDDTNANGQRDSGELGSSGVSVSLQGVVGAPVTAITDAQGNYKAEVKGLTALITVTPPVNMAVSTGNNPQTVDVTPAGSSSAAPVGLSKIDVRFVMRVDRPALEVGSAVKITGTIVNNSPVALVGSSVSFKLPAGLAVNPSSLPAGGRVSAPIAGVTTVTLPVVNIAPGKSFEVNLVASATPALQSSNTITATLNATSDSKPISTPINRQASASVTRSNAGALGNQTQVGGQVYLDANNNRVFDTGDTVLKGVRVLSSLGVSAITDAGGFYTFPALSAGRVTVRLDPASSVSSTQIGLFDNQNAVTLQLTGGAQIADFALPVGSLSVGQVLETTLTRGSVSVTKRVTMLSANQVSVEMVITVGQSVKAFKLAETAKQTVSNFDTSLDGALFNAGIMTVSNTIDAGSYTVMYKATITDGSSPYALLDFDFYFREVTP